jgi:hypothetical protein
VFDLWRSMALGGNQGSAQSDLEREFLLGSFRGVRPGFEKGERLRTMGNGFLVCTALERIFPRQMKIMNGPLILTTTLEVRSQFASDIALLISITSFLTCSNLSMKPPAAIRGNTTV